MRAMIGRLCRLLLLGLLLACGPAAHDAAAESPAGPALRGPPVATAEPGPLARIGAAWLGFQRDVNATITATMRSLRDGGSPALLWTAIGLAFAYGVLHALGPGHGKAVVIAYFLGHEARIGRGLLMGTQIAVMHVISAAVVVVLADQLLRRAFGGVPAEIPAIRYVSYGLILAVGLGMLVSTVRRHRAAHGHHHDHRHHHDHEHHHGHEHAQGPAGDARHRHAVGCGCHAPPKSATGLLALAVGLVPCTGAILILLYALANGVLGAGLVLVAAIAAGMAVTMGALGLASVHARRLVLVGAASDGRRAMALELAGAVFITGFALLLLATTI